MTDPKENAIEWFVGDSYMTCTFQQRKYINKAKRYLASNPSFDGKLIENKDGSIVVRLPLKALRLCLKTRVNNGVEEVEETEVEE